MSSRRAAVFVGVALLGVSNAACLGYAVHHLIAHGAEGWLLVWFGHSVLARDVVEFWTKWAAEVREVLPHPHQHLRECDPGEET